MSTHPDAITIQASLAAAARALQSRADAELLLAHVLGVPRTWLLAHGDEAMAAAQRAQFEAELARRVGGVPLAYVLGEWGFWSLSLQVTPATLIPRPETELLVELALARIAPDRPVRLADLGTGSGAVALALAAERPCANVLATDCSEAALQVAQANARRLGLERARFACGDWCAALGDARFDLIVANPPYIEAGDPHLLQGDLRFEPHAALASGVDGLDAIRAIVAGAPGHLEAGAWVLLEHGWQQGAAVRDLLHAGGFREVFTALDLEHRERVSGGRHS